MQSLLETFLTTQILAFLLTFTRVGAAVMIMPGVGDSFVPQRVRLLIAFALSFVLFPFVSQYMPPEIPNVYVLVTMIAQELVIGVLFGTIGRIFMTSMDTAGQVISTQSGLSNAQVFNPSLATQGSIMGAFLSMSGVVVLFATNMHHLLITGVMDTYTLFPMGEMPNTGDMAEFVSRSVAASFMIGVKLASPFIVMTLLIYVGMGVMSRLMPQIQIFMVALPLQIWLSIVLLMIVVTALLGHWAVEFDAAMSVFLSPAN